MADDSLSVPADVPACSLVQEKESTSAIRVNPVVSVDFMVVFLLIKDEKH